MKVARARYGRAIAIAVWTILLTGTLAIVLDLPIVGAIRSALTPAEPPGAGLEIRNVSARPLANSSTVIVECAVANVSRRPREVPQLRAVARRADRSDLKDWVVSIGGTLMPGEVATYRLELADMPPGSENIALSFTERR
jgi:hypothetical protein